ncbi:MAG: hypothetical protein AAGC46_02695 [Solirubrobacteraceae bacterium]|nr:hypothetical protein [Patulibacter sp.]
MSESRSFQPGVEPAEARAALDAVRAAQVGVGRQLVVPRGYDAVYALSFGIFVVGIAMINAPHGGAPVMVGGVALVLAAAATLAGLMRWFRRANGYWLAGTTPPRARWVAWAAGVEVGVFVFLGSLAGSDGRWGLTALAAVVASIGGYALSRLWLTVYRAEIRGA